MYGWADWIGSIIRNLNLPQILLQLLADKPVVLEDDVWEDILKRHNTIREFQNTCISIFLNALKSDDKELIHWLLNETIQSYSLDYHKSLRKEYYTKPVFFRTDEMILGKIAEIQCPGSLWGELELLYNFYKYKEFDLFKLSPAQTFANQLSQF